MDLSFFDNNIIINFINRLKIGPAMKKRLIEKVPNFSDEEKIFLWKTLIDIYQMEEEEKKALENIDNNF